MKQIYYFRTWTLPCYIFLLITPLLVNGSTNITLLFGGDVSFAGAVRYFANKKTNGCDYKKPFANIREYFHSADISMVNLESPLSDVEQLKNPMIPGKFALHFGEPRAVEGLRYLGVKAVNLANNHFTDFGLPAINQTLALLEKANILPVGVTKGRKTYLPQKPAVITIKGIKIAILGYCYLEEGCMRTRKLVSFGPAIYEKRQAMRDIQYARNKLGADHVIVFMHWGKEYLSVPLFVHQKEAYSMLDLGASVIVGSHSHVRQLHVLHNNRLIEYGLGNLLMMTHTSLGKVFLPHKNITSNAENDYLRTANHDWDVSAYGFLLKVTLNKEKMLSSSVLNIRIMQNGPCLQAFPGKDGWIEHCSDMDLFCRKLDGSF